MATATEIIKRCGGYKAVAEQLGLHRTAVLRWTYPAKNGPGDQIPPERWASVIRLAQQLGIEITIDDLAPPEAVQAASGEPAQAAA